MGVVLRSVLWRVFLPRVELHYIVDIFTFCCAAVATSLICLAFYKRKRAFKNCWRLYLDVLSLKPTHKSRSSLPLFLLSIVLPDCNCGAELEVFNHRWRTHVNTFPACSCVESPPHASLTTGVAKDESGVTSSGLKGAVSSMFHVWALLNGPFCTCPNTFSHSTALQTFQECCKGLSPTHSWQVKD